MTAKMTIVSTSLVAGLLLMAAFPILLPHVAFPILLPHAAPAITTVEVGRGADELFATMARRHTDGHRPYQDIRANQIVLEVLGVVGQTSFLPPGQQDPSSQVLCYAVKYGEQTLRIAVHAILDPASGIGATVVINPSTPQTPYLSAFESSRENFLAGDHITRFQKSYPGTKWEEADCSQLPPGPTPLAP